MSDPRVIEYLKVLGYDEKTTVQPSVEVLSELMSRHIRKIPFNNLGMHAHPADGKFEAIPQKLPTLDVDACIGKMLSGHGGFCFEINISFCWLLRQIGFTVRMAEAAVVTPGGPVPGHCLLFVDGLDQAGALMVDPGIGDFVRVVVPMSLKESGGSVEAENGDKYSLQAIASADDFPAPWCPRMDTVLMVERKAGLMSNPTCEPLGVPDMPIAPAPAVPKYVFASKDDLKEDGPEFSFGLGAVLTVMPQNFFSQKKFAVVATDQGFKYIGATYTKEKAFGAQVSRADHDGEAGFRQAAAEFPIQL